MEKLCIIYCIKLHSLCVCVHYLKLRGPYIVHKVDNNDSSKSCHITLPSLDIVMVIGWTSLCPTEENYLSNMEKPIHIHFNYFSNFTLHSHIRYTLVKLMEFKENLNLTLGRRKAQITERHPVQYNVLCLYIAIPYTGDILDCEAELKNYYIYHTLPLNV